jgi:uncharacterized SAM-binding protein YcdF (DUF218 family)
MYYVAAALLRPLVLAHLVVAAALVALWRKERDGRRRLAVLTGAYLLLTLLSLPVTSYLALASLERGYPPLARRPADAAAIVVLSGSLRRVGPGDAGFEPGTDTLYRCVRAAELYRQAPCPVLVTGGKVHAGDPGPAVAAVMRDFLLTQGVRPDDLLVEDGSRTTYENAAASARLLETKGLRRVVLVTDAAHLRRAEACFRRQGVDVVPCGCRYRTAGGVGTVADFLPDAGAAVGVGEAAHEWLGLAWYWLTDKL